MVLGQPAELGEGVDRALIGLLERAAPAGGPQARGRGVHPGGARNQEPVSAAAGGWPGRYRPVSGLVGAQQLSRVGEDAGGRGVAIVVAGDRQQHVADRRQFAVAAQCQSIAATDQEVHAQSEGQHPRVGEQADDEPAVLRPHLLHEHGPHDLQEDDEQHGHGQAGELQAAEPGFLGGEGVGTPPLRVAAGRVAPLRGPVAVRLDQRHRTLRRLPFTTLTNCHQKGWSAPAEYLSGGTGYRQEGLILGRLSQSS